jgi:hypothetical protein
MDDTQMDPVAADPALDPVEETETEEAAFTDEEVVAEESAEETE